MSDLNSIVSMLPIRTVLFPFLDTRDASALRLTCQELKQAVTDFPWEDMGTVIRGSIAQWRACFPRARGAYVRQMGMYGQNPNGRLTAVVDGDFVHFVGLRALNMSYCRQVTDAAFVHLRGIERLDMSWCNQTSITDAAFVHLRGIQELDMSFCDQATITDAAFAHLVGIQRLSIQCCYTATITDAAFAHLVGIQELNMRDCSQATITSAVFEHLKGIPRLRCEGIPCLKYAPLRYGVSCAHTGYTPVPAPTKWVTRAEMRPGEG